MTPDKAVDHAMSCLRESTDLTIARSDRNTGGPQVCQWFHLGTIINCHAHASETASDKIVLSVQIGIVASVRVSLTFDEERDVAILRDAVSFYARHYGTGGDQ